MIENNFDSRTLANMTVALDRVCSENPRGEDHRLRKRVAREIIKSARGGNTTLGDLEAAGRHALASIAASAAERVRPLEQHRALSRDAVRSAVT
jgi:hypothetical protein